jgi:hypothetical protein
VVERSLATEPRINPLVLRFVPYIVGLIVAVLAAVIASTVLSFLWLSWPAAVTGGLVIGIAAGVLATALWPPTR